ncbi:NADH:flavin oxidoreductase/NADH oxidase [Pseudomonas luteola]|uniref:NADH:flavin oxidoreductase/NADH oxidase n=1 Tax=Pseudomonas luteola TaxID=47886 RepID=A0ABS0MPQ3_PSELU|nr:NADH:flavin oxidoreductase/NADH oxidase [Pseudomonas luteola]MBH3438703.1 NADH:flavin oxidoreductase/NADH oxidase [Pseudomonas luteola]
MADLFSELKIKDVTLRNRIAVSPMCQYMAKDGMPNEWHFQNYASRAAGGAGLIVVEASAVSPEGRITPADLGIWNDEQAEAYKPIVNFIKSTGAVAGIQIAHAGRKASANRPWEGDDHLPEDHPLAWETIGPSDNAFGAHLPRAPKQMTVEDIHRVTADFVAAAKRALAAGFELLELHFAHGYLAQSFFSPLANKRTDEYGGDFEGRARFLLETFQAVREVWPQNLPLIVRLGVTDFVEGDQGMEESIELVRRFKEGGMDLIDVSMGFNTPDVSNVPWGKPGFMGEKAKQITDAVDVLTSISWSIREPKDANELIESGQTDLIMLGKAVLGDPFWPYHAAIELGRENPQDLLPPPYAAWLKRR